MDDVRRPAAFLDRDGVINVDRGYVGEVENFEFVDGAVDAIAHLNRSGYLVFVVTNQSGIGRGYFKEEAYRRITDHMRAILAEAGAHIDDIRYCPYHPEAKREEYRMNHPWRKPSPGMINDLLRCWAVDLEESFLIGDSKRDLDAAAAAGIKGYLFQGGNLSDFLKSINPDIKQVP